MWTEYLQSTSRSCPVIQQQYCRWLLSRQTVLSLPFPGRTRSFGEDKFHIGNADKAQECGQIWRYQIRWAIFMDPTAAGDNDGFLPVTRPSGPFSV